jgi:hypothetical protein
MKKDESVQEMFHRLQVLVNDLKALGEEVKDKDFFHKFLRCLPSRHIGHYSSEEWFGHHDTKPTVAWTENIRRVPKFGFSPRLGQQPGLKGV